MKSAFISAFLLAFAKFSFAVNVCNQEISDTSVLQISCPIYNPYKYPNYKDYTTFYACDAGLPKLQKCETGLYFCYYQQMCVPCAKFLPPPNCEYFEAKMNMKCSGTVTTKAPPVTKTTSSGTTSSKPTLRPTVTTPKPPVTTRKPIPTPPSQSSTSSGIPMPPMVVTPVKGIPTPPNEDITPPSIPGTPPMLTTVPSI